MGQDLPPIGAEVPADLAAGDLPPIGSEVPQPGAPSTAPGQRSLTDTLRGQVQILPGVSMDTAKTAVDVGKGFVREAAKRASSAGEFVKQHFPKIYNAFDVGPRVSFETESKNAAEKTGAFGENLAEFVAGGAAAEGVTGVVKAAPVVSALARGVAQGATAYGISKGQGASETGSRVNAAVSAISPAVGLVLSKAAPALRQAAMVQLSRVFATGLENKGPMVDYALGKMAPGTSIPPQIGQAVSIVRRAASDTLDLPIQTSWGKWQTILANDATAKGKNLADALATTQFGQIPLPKAQIEQALEDLSKSTAEHFAQVSQGGYKFLTFDEPLFKEIAALKDTLGQYHDTVTVQNLVDLKRVWDSAVYSLSTVGKVGVSPDVLVSNAMKEAAFTGANAIRAALEKGAPEISQLNDAVSHAIHLQDLVTKLYKVNPSLAPTAKYAAELVGAGAGAAIGRELGGHYLIGMAIGDRSARLLVRALESPAWQTAPSIVKDRIAKAIANGQGAAVADLLKPFLAAGTSKATQPTPAAK